MSRSTDRDEPRGIAIMMSLTRRLGGTGGRWVETTPGLAFAGQDAYALRGLTRVPGQTTMWVAGDVSRTPSSPVWDSLIARYP